MSDQKTKYLKDIINPGSHDAILHWLRISGIRPFTAANEAEFYTLLDKHVADNKVRLGQLRKVALELEENGGKRVYLGKLSNYKTIGLRQRFENHLKNLRLSLSAEPTEPRRLTERPNLTYIYWSTKEVRIGYSEKHLFLKQNRSNMTLEYEPQTNLIIISVDPRTGLAHIMMDAPGDRHPHQSTPGDRKEKYEEYFRNRMLEILGASEFRPIDLVDVAGGIKKLGTTVFEETYADERTPYNSRLRTSSRSDVRQDPAYSAGAKIDGDKRVVESLSGFWLPSGQALQRKVWMHLSMKEGMVQFAAHLLSDEIEYAISRIRAI